MGLQRIDERRRIIMNSKCSQWNVCIDMMDIAGWMNLQREQIHMSPMDTMKVQLIMILDDVDFTDSIWYVFCCDGVIRSLFYVSQVSNKNHMLCLDFMNRGTYVQSYKFVCILLSIESGQRISLFEIYFYFKYTATHAIL